MFNGQSHNKQLICSLQITVLTRPHRELHVITHLIKWQEHCAINNKTHCMFTFNLIKTWNGALKLKWETLVTFFCPYPFEWLCSNIKVKLMFNNVGEKNVSECLFHLFTWPNFQCDLFPLWAVSLVQWHRQCTHQLGQTQTFTAQSTLDHVGFKVCTRLLYIH